MRIPGRSPRRLTALVVVFMTGSMLVPAIGAARASDQPEFPLGDQSFADAVVRHTPGSDVAPPHDDPKLVLGPPAGESGAAPYAMGNGLATCEAELVVEFRDNYLVDVDGIDLWIFEVGPFAEAVEVFIGNPGEPWIGFGRIEGGREGVDIGTLVEPDQTFTLVRLCDWPDGITTGSPFGGPDIDAIGAVGAKPRPGLIVPLLVDGLAVGERIELSVELDGIEISGQEIEWAIALSQSINPAVLPNQIEVCRVDGEGVLSALNVGHCIVRATVGDVWIDKRLEVICSRDEEVGDLGRLFDLHELRFPESPFLADLEAGRIGFPFGDMRRGSANNILSLSEPRYQGHTCGACQDKTLAFLHEVEAHPEECRLLSGYEYGPIEGSFGTHHAVVVYPEGTAWRETGVVFDPWPYQRPSRWSVADWASEFGGYGLYPIRGSTLEHNRLRYPTTRDSTDFGGLNFGRMTSRVWDLIQGASLCPADLLIVDDQGRRTGVIGEGQFVHEAPGALLLRLIREGNGYEWYFALDPGRSAHYDVRIAGTDDGRFHLMVADPDRGILHYGEQPIKQGQTASIELGAAGAAELVAADGTLIPPQSLSAESTPGPGRGIAAIAVGAAAAALAGVAIALRRRRRPQKV